MAAQAVDRLADFCLAPVEERLFGGCKRPHTWIGACRSREGYPRPLPLQFDQPQIGRIAGQCRCEQPLQPHALVSQPPQHQVMANIVQVAVLHRHNRVQSDAYIRVESCPQQLPQPIQRKRIFERGTEPLELVAAQRDQARCRSFVVGSSDSTVSTA